MKRALFLLLAVIAAAGTLPFAAISSPGNNFPDPQRSPASPAALLAFPYKPRELLVRFKDPLPPVHLSRLMDEAGAKPIRKLPLVPGLYLVSTSLEDSPEEILGRLLQDENVLYAEPNYVCSVAQTIPNDPRFNDLWGMEKIQAPRAWNLATGAPEVVVAVIDTGVDYNHEDLNANMWTNTDGTHGYNAVANTRYPLDDHGHGTHVAGTIGAVGNNLKGVVGLNWKVKIMALKFLDAAGDGYTDDAIDCIDFAVNNGARVLNNSWEVEQFSQAMFDAIKAADQAGILFVAAAGNGGKNIDVSPVYPASYNIPNVIAAAYTTQSDLLSSLSNYGPTRVHVGAPGSAILSTVLNNGYGTKSGTSMAAPHVSGLAALLMGYRPALDHLTIKQVIIDSVDSVVSLQGMVSSGGRVNAHQALLRSLNPASTRTKWYFPAGGTRINNIDFDHYLCVFNPGPEPVQANVSFLDENGLIGETAFPVGAGDRNTIRVNDVIGDNRAHVSAIVTADQAILCERAMYFPGGGEPASWIGSHNTVGLTVAGMEWFLNEGATHLFDQFIHILNPEIMDTQVTVTFFNQDGMEWSSFTTLGGMKVWTVKANEVADNQPQLSTRVTSSRPVAVDRTMYWPKSDWRDGHATVGVRAQNFANDWYLPEGATHIFDEYVLVANPNQTESANVNFTFTDQFGNSWIYDAVIAPQKRYTVKVNNVVGEITQISTRVKSDIPVAAERAMYFPRGNPGDWMGGHVTVGASSPQRRWYLPEGATHIFDEYVLVANPSTTQSADVNFAFRDHSGNAWNHNRIVQPRERHTIKVNNLVGPVAQLSTVVESDIPIVAERAMYLPMGGPWSTGHVTVGYGEAAP